MLVEIKDNQIVIKISETESNFLTQKALQAGQKDVCSYVKAKLLEALGLQNFEGRAMLEQADEFDLKIIKLVSSQFNRPKPLTPVDYKPSKGAKSEASDHKLTEEKSSDATNTKAEVQEETSTKNIETDLLNDLLDKDLLEGRLPGGNKSASEMNASNEAKLNQIPSPAKENKPTEPSSEPPPEPKSRKRSSK